MKRTLSLAAALALSATSAFGQDRQGSNVYFRASGAGVEDAGLVDLITRMLDKSRLVHRVEVPDDGSIELEAPIRVVRESDGKRVTVTYEISPPGGQGGRTYTATCTSTQLDRCADAIIVRTERAVRELAFARSGGAMRP